LPLRFRTPNHFQKSPSHCTRPFGSHASGLLRGHSLTESKTLQEKARLQLCLERQRPACKKHRDVSVARLQEQATRLALQSKHAGGVRTGSLDHSLPEKTAECNRIRPYQSNEDFVITQPSSRIRRRTSRRVSGRAGNSSTLPAAAKFRSRYRTWLRLAGPRRT